MRQRRCERCGSMADVTRQKKLQITVCSKCKHKTIKHIIRKGAGG